MSGLLSGVLPAIYSASDKAKRLAKSLLDDPAAFYQQQAAQLAENIQANRAIDKQAFGDPNNPLKVTNYDALKQSIGGYMGGLMGLAPVGMTVWHGSPHSFTQFDSSKIGTGEGAQAYGHGLYVAESPAVANSYKEALANPSSPLNDAAKYWKDNGGEKAFLDFAKTAGLDEQQISQIVGAIKGNGSLYKIDLPDEHIARMLDWDKPLSQQHPDVQQFLNGPVMQGAIQKLKQNGELGDYSAQELAKFKGEAYHDWLRQANQDSNIAPAQILRDAGIPGIRYLDGGSRGAGTGTSNFVVFPGNENLLTIQERNGQPINGLLGQ